MRQKSFDMRLEKYTLSKANRSSLIYALLSFKLDGYHSQAKKTGHCVLDDEVSKSGESRKLIYTESRKLVYTLRGLLPVLKDLEVNPSCHRCSPGRSIRPAQVVF